MSNLITPTVGTRIEGIRTQSGDYGKIYRITRVNHRTKTVALFSEHQQREINDAYSFSNLTTERWKVVVTLTECPECNNEKVIPEGDFLCQDCRKSIPVEGRVIAERDGAIMIAYLTGTSESLTIAADDLPGIILKRADVGPTAMEVLKRFVNG